MYSDYHQKQYFLHLNLTPHYLYLWITCNNIRTIVCKGYVSFERFLHQPLKRCPLSLCHTQLFLKCHLTKQLGSIRYWFLYWRYNLFPKPARDRFHLKIRQRSAESAYFSVLLLSSAPVKVVWEAVAVKIKRLRTPVPGLITYIWHYSASCIVFPSSSAHFIRL